MLIVGGTMPSRSASSVAIDSTAPVPPSRCPVIDLVLVMARPSAASPNAFLIALISPTSPIGVEVPCALMCTTSDGFRPASASARLMDEAMPSGLFCTMSLASAE